ncbi:cyclophilin seven suppressor, putative [Entamoeba dispar SAW760]|uniref:Cyclophilin seven suppressor, putative n=1 Tax=Entamoeba dispar (strain ATCC PRA-260 / SAW760) TaxID=370354 RepID=B0E7J5_ENTDS|nr:cyclophilin seven suppressor, putative [Entamoeba dispar SAW760]EDR29497.1 cyclophilin seven suppressor, putative [Entamoeba dispar SAW760]|eukprot:EDR29497.1 cyclophilin seven suppressor, putative [Entamoeba dispar SAW760]
MTNIPWEQNPFFATEVPENGNELFDALAALKYEGTPDEQATNFREQGNECFKVGKIKDAFEYYTEGIQAKPTDLNLLAALYSNRAACQIKMENFGRAYEDCTESLKCVPNNVKCYYRMATAKLRLHKYDDALVCIDLGLNLKKNDPEFIKLRDFCTEMKKRMTITEEPKNYEKFLRKKGIIQRDFDLMTDMGMYIPLNINIDEDSDVLLFPVIVLYPESNQSDCLRDCTPDTQLEDILFTLMADGLPWDKAHRYNIKNCIVKVHDKQTDEQVVILKQMKLMNLLRNYSFLYKSAAFLYVYPAK